MLTYKKIDKHRFSNEIGLAVTPEQATYVCADLAIYVRDWKDDVEVECYVIENHGTPVGFFALDFSLKRSQASIGDEPNSCTMKSFFIDHRLQGQGLASEALKNLDSLIATSYPLTRKLFLTVNFKNLAAIKTYLKCEFTVVGNPYLGGAAGPQHVMARAFGESKSS